ncbi:hypothetical protein [Gehongia tenuis]|uniref:Uncharacterized protein n=1 Tax=Gehongia tenuis TaxID=2763655 RepID=A0A926HNY0_9FIRM|nr:hypothetical protein [Gehongia tenuis]MBC8531094.1 hypothetical protein [Gehongia tenuis]
MKKSCTTGFIAGSMLGIAAAAATAMLVPAGPLSAKRMKKYGRKIVRMMK